MVDCLALDFARQPPDDAGVAAIETVGDAQHPGEPLDELTPVGLKGGEPSVPGGVGEGLFARLTVSVTRRRVCPINSSASRGRMKPRVIISGSLVNTCPDRSRDKSNHNDTVAGQRFALTHHIRIDITYPRTIDKHQGSRNTYCEDAHLAVFELKHLAVLNDGDILRWNPNHLGQTGMLFQLAQFAVDRDEIFGLHQVNQQFHFFLAGMTGDMHRGNGFIDHIPRRARTGG